MMTFLERVAALAREGQPFATATVVARRPPVSAHLGDHAIVFADGRMEGFVGGACSREIIRQQAIDVLHARHGRLVSIRPDAGAASASDPEHVVVPMTCVSEGAVDVYIEPHLPKRRLVVVGTTPVAEALTRTATSVLYDVVRVIDATEQRDLERDSPAQGFAVSTLDALDAVLMDNAAETAVVVASQGHYDEQALETALRRGAEYIGLVASRKRGATILSLLENNGVPDVAKVRSPAGLDLGARTPPEVALSILAEIIQLRPSESLRSARAGVTAAAAAAVEPKEAPATAIDPVCGMTVTIATARHTADVDGVRYYFCGASCRAKFVQEPVKYLAPKA